MTTKNVVLLAACLWMYSTATAQRTWIVNSAGGSGTDFTDLPPAVAAAAPGDTVLLMPGLGVPYRSDVTIGKGIRVVGCGSSPLRLRGRCVLSRVPEGQMMLLHNLDITDATGSFTGIQAAGCRGTVLLSGIHDGLDYFGGVWVTDSTRVFYQKCRLQTPGGAVLLERSAVWLLDCDISAPGPAVPFNRQAALWIDASYVGLIGGHYKGADVAGNGCVWGNPAAEPAVVASNSQVVLAGGVVMQGGYCTASLYRATAFLQGGIPIGSYSSWHVRDPDVRFIDSCDTGLVPTVEHEITSVFPRDAARGQPQTIDVEGPSNGIVSVYASLAHGYAPIALPVGDVWLDPSLTLHVSTGPVDAQRRYQATTRIPSWLPIGTPLVYQAVALTSRGTFELSTPGFAVVE